MMGLEELGGDSRVGKFLENRGRNFCETQSIFAISVSLSLLREPSRLCPLLQGIPSQLISLYNLSEVMNYTG